MKVEIIRTYVDYKEVKNICRSTVNKDKSDKEATEEFKAGILISEHTPIRIMRIQIRIEGIKNWVVTHFVRHGWTPFVSTQRDDKTGEDRDSKRQDALVNVEFECNPQNLIDIARKRLCLNSHKETREVALLIKKALMEREDTKEIGEVLVPNCIYRMGCPEVFSYCPYFREFQRVHKKYEIDSIKKRNELYNQYTFKVKD